MRYQRPVMFLASLAFVLTCAAAVQAADRPLNILFIGNSFTQVSNVATKVRDVATSAGFATPNVTDASVGGQTLQYHSTNAATLANVDKGSWDYVVLQEYSTRPVNNPAAYNANPARFEQDAAWFYDRIKATSPNAKVVLYETWARQENNTEFYPTLFQNRDTMQNQLNFWYHDAVENYIPTHATSAVKTDLLLAPCGEVWAADYHGTNYMLHGSDLYHQNDLGAHVNAMTIFSTIYGVHSMSLPGGSAGQENYLRGLVDSKVFPEPATLSLLGLGALGLLRRRK